MVDLPNNLNLRFPLTHKFIKLAYTINSDYNDNISKYNNDIHYMSNTLSMIYNYFVSIHGIGITKTNSLIYFFRDKRNLLEIESLYKVLNISDPIMDINNNDSILNKKIVLFTGTLIKKTDKMQLKMH